MIFFTLVVSLPRLSAEIMFRGCTLFFLVNSNHSLWVNSIRHMISKRKSSIENCQKPSWENLCSETQDLCIFPGALVNDHYFILSNRSVPHPQSDHGFPMTWRRRMEQLAYLNSAHCFSFFNLSHSFFSCIPVIPMAPDLRADLCDVFIYLAFADCPSDIIIYIYILLSELWAIQMGDQTQCRTSGIPTDSCWENLTWWKASDFFTICVQHKCGGGKISRGNQGPLREGRGRRLVTFALILEVA